MAADSTPGPGIPEESGSTGTRGRGEGRRRKPREKRKGLKIMAWTAAGIVVLGGTGAGYLYFKLNGTIDLVVTPKVLDNVNRLPNARRFGTVPGSWSDRFSF